MPNLPKFPRLPKPPRISTIIEGINPLKEIIQDSREVIKGAREEVSEVASSLRVERAERVESAPTRESQEEPPFSQNEAVATGTACIPCCRDHLSTSSSALSEGIRFARDKGVKDPEALRRIRIALDELNIMERIDLAPDETAKLKGAEKDLANWTLKGSREIRHAITAIKDVESMEQAAAKASAITEEFIGRLWAIPEEECETCGEARESIRQFVEKRKRERAGI